MVTQYLYQRNSHSVVVAKIIVLECCPPPECCDMRGLLSFSILYLLHTKPMYGSEIADELAKRRFDKPNPGTIYPALKAMEAEGLIRVEDGKARKKYRLTREGQKGLRDAARYFVQAYGEIVDEFRAGRV